MTPAPESPARPEGGTAAPSGPLDFVRLLAQELLAGDVRLPSFPEVANRVRQVLADERATPAQIGRVIAADAALAARVLRIANSATFNPGGRPVTELAAAVARLGHDLVRCAAVSFALQQMKQFGGQPTLRPQLQELWMKSTVVAALAYTLARESRVGSADEALIAGLLHNVGRLYIVTRAQHVVVAGAASAAWDEMLHVWHPQIGRSILQHWEFPTRIVEAVGEQNAWSRRMARGPQLTEVLICSIALVPCVWYRELLADTVAAVPAFQGLGLDEEACRRFLTESAEQVRQLRDALAGA